MLPLISRAAVSIWKPKVTALSDLKPHQLNQVNYGEDGKPYIQKTSLAYTQPVSTAFLVNQSLLWRL